MFNFFYRKERKEREETEETEERKEMSKKIWKRLRTGKEETPIILVSVSSESSNRRKYNKIISMTYNISIYGDSWTLDWHMNPEEIIYCEPGALFMFAQPNKIIDFFLIKNVEKNRVILTQIYGTILWYQLFSKENHPKINFKTPLIIDSKNRFYSVINEKIEEWSKSFFEK